MSERNLLQHERKYKIKMDMLSENNIHKVGRIDQIVRDYFKYNPSVSSLPAKKLMI